MTARTYRGRALLGGRIVDHARVRVEDGTLVACEPGARHRGDIPLPPDLLLAPGLLDIHVHGAFGADASAGSEAIRAMARGLADRGVTAFLPTAVSAPLPVLAAIVAAVRSVERRPGGGEARILGANLEGPALAPGHAGAQPRSALTAPSRIEAAWRADPAAWADVRIVTVAPELPGAASLIAILRRAGVAVSLGHSGASLEEARAGYAAGAISTTHLFNAMSGLDHRAPGLAAAALLERRAFVELIADGHHVDPALWPLAWRLAGRRLVLVSDAMAAAGRPDGRYELGGEPVSVESGVARRRDGRLAGSTITVADAVANSVAAGLPLAAAIGAATSAPARLLARRDIGAIRPGGRADMVLVDRAGRVRRTMLGGAWLEGKG